MGYLDRARDLMKETGPEAKTGIDCAKGVISAKSLPETKPLTERYHLKYPDSQTTEQELREIEARVHKEGFVLLWSHTLGDLVAFYKSEADRKRIPPGFVPYSEQELREVFGERKAPLSEQSLRLIHEVKKQGAKITDSKRTPFFIVYEKYEKRGKAAT